MSPLGVFGPRTGHKPLFAEVCRLHQFDRKTRSLVYSIAAKYRPNRLAEVFVNPAVLRKAIEDPEFEDSAEQLQELYGSWFGGE